MRVLEFCGMYSNGNWYVHRYHELSVNVMRLTPWVDWCQVRTADVLHRFSVVLAEAQTTAQSLFTKFDSDGDDRLAEPELNRLFCWLLPALDREEIAALVATELDILVPGSGTVGARNRGQRSMSLRDLQQLMTLKVYNLDERGVSLSEAAVSGG